VSAAVAAVLAANQRGARLGGSEIRVERVLTNEDALAAGYEAANGSAVVELSLTPMPADPSTVLGVPRWFDRGGEGAADADLVRSSAQPARMGVLCGYDVPLEHAALFVGSGEVGTLLAIGE
jgi:hypothetical protein